MATPRLVPVGKISRAHGIRGALKIYPYGESLAVQQTGDILYLHAHDGQTIELTLVSLRPSGRLLIGEFEEIHTREHAEKFLGAEISLPLEHLSPTSKDEYYYFQLIGLQVETREGSLLGTLTRIIETGSNDVYVVNREGKELLIPALLDVILEVDLVRGRMVVQLPEGLIDDL
jgi:16S rRNA processing protein RimM